MIVAAEKNSKATIVETARANGMNGQVFRSQIVEVIVKENAYVEYVAVQNFSKFVYNFSQRKAKVMENGFMY